MAPPVRPPFYPDGPEARRRRITSRPRLRGRPCTPRRTPRESPARRRVAPTTTARDAGQPTSGSRSTTTCRYFSPSKSCSLHSKGPGRVHARLRSPWRRPPNAYSTLCRPLSHPFSSSGRVPRPHSGQGRRAGGTRTPETGSSPSGRRLGRRTSRSRRRSAAVSSASRSAPRTSNPHPGSYGSPDSQ